MWTGIGAIGETMNDSQVESLDIGKHPPDALQSTTGFPEEMRAEEERLLIKGYTRVPVMTPDDKLLDREYKWGAPSKTRSLFRLEVVLTWREPKVKKSIPY